MRVVAEAAEPTMVSQDLAVLVAAVVVPVIALEVLLAPTGTVVVVVARQVSLPQQEDLVLLLYVPRLLRYQPQVVQLLQPMLETMFTRSWHQELLHFKKRKHTLWP